MKFGSLWMTSIRCGSNKKIDVFLGLGAIKRDLVQI